VGHLNAVAAKASHNLMPNYNLAAIWGPTLLTVDGQVRFYSSQFRREIFRPIFLVLCSKKLM
jgi:hypothetical protein